MEQSRMYYKGATKETKAYVPVSTAKRLSEQITGKQRPQDSHVHMSHHRQSQILTQKVRGRALPVSSQTRLLVLGLVSGAHLE